MLLTTSQHGVCYFPNGVLGSDIRGSRSDGDGSPDVWALLGYPQDVKNPNHQSTAFSVGIGPFQTAPDYSLQYQSYIALDHLPGWWDLNCQNVTGGRAMSLSNASAAESHQANPNGGLRLAAKVQFPNGYYVGGFPLSNNFAGKVVTLAGAGPPPRGIWNPGDRILNNVPKPGGYAGWICVQATVYTGTPPGYADYVETTPATWKGFGLIAT
jgi:hypothetical protein